MNEIDNPTLKQKVTHSLKWVLATRLVIQLVRWVVTFYVIRLLTPQDYGSVALADILFSFITTLAMQGLINPIVQSQKVENKVLSEYFGIIIIIYFSLFFIQYLSADLVASLYGNAHIADILRVTSFCLLILAFDAIPTALLSRKLAFKQLSLVVFVSDAIAAITTLILAYSGFGFWSLVIGEVVSITLRTIGKIILQPYPFGPKFSLRHSRSLVKLVGAMSLFALLSFIIQHLDITLGGLVLTATQIGIFSVSLQIALMPLKKLLPIIRQVAMPAFSSIQKDVEKIKKYTLKAQRMGFLITFPIFWGLSSISDLIIPLVIGDKWNDAIIPVTLLSLIMPFRFSEELFMPTLTGLRREDILIENSFIILIIMLIAIYIGMSYGATGLAAAWLLGFPLAYIITTHRTAKELGLRYRLMYQIMYSPIIASLIMYFFVYLTKTYLPVESKSILLISSMIIGAICFVVTSVVINKKGVDEMLQLFKKE